MDQAVPSDVTSIETTSVKTQVVSDCWLHTMSAWAESLHKEATGRELDMSEPYWDYWYWYEQITDSDILPYVGSGFGIVESGNFGLGASLIERYGWMEERDFTFTVAAPWPSRRASQAIHQSLTSGALSSDAARRDPKLVRDELNRAWNLAPSVVAEMERAFPIVPLANAPLPSLAERLAQGPLGLDKIRTAQELVVLGVDLSSNATLADAIGKRTEGSRPVDMNREGDGAWSYFPYRFRSLQERRKVLKYIQSVLHRRLPIPLLWNVSFNNAENGAFRLEYEPKPFYVGGHVALLVDYEVTNVPGFGTLPVGAREQRPEALAASLDDAAKITFFRVKNSWGDTPAWTVDAELPASGDHPQGPRWSYLPSMPGFNDLYMSYLDGEDMDGSSAEVHPHGALVGFVLPRPRPVTPAATPP